MPRGLYRLHHSGSAHFITFRCYRRLAYLQSARGKRLFEIALEEARRKYGLLVFGYVVMPEHVHLLISEPERGTVANAMQSLKISSAKRSKPHTSQTMGDVDHPFWEKRYYDRNVRGKEFTEKLRYIHRNPVKRNLVGHPEDWKWSSYRHYLTGENSGVEIECWRSRTYSFPVS